MRLRSMMGNEKGEMRNNLAGLKGGERGKGHCDTVAAKGTKGTKERRELRDEGN